MKPEDLVAATALPVTRESLCTDFQKMGIEEGDTLLVHSSLSSLGWVCGGEETVVLALQDVLGENGTLVMPAHTANNTEPSNWQYPPVPKEWWPIIRSSMPAFNPVTTPTAYMGRIPECFRMFPGVIRSNHPIGSFAAWGKHAAAIVADHPLEPMFGDQSPIGRLYNRNAKVLLLGVSYDRCTSLHLAEYRSRCTKKMIQEGTAMMVNGVRAWVDFAIVALETDDFEQIGAAFEERGQVGVGKVAKAPARVFQVREIVDFGVSWMDANRSS
jgi:aminoglycoside 3-N-acetyltransferase